MQVQDKQPMNSQISPQPDYERTPHDAAHIARLPLYVLDSAHGLPSNQIHGLARDSLSRLWLATPAGLACWDGSFIRHWNRGSGLHCNGLRSVVIDNHDCVWIGSDLGIERLDFTGSPRACIDQQAWRFGLAERIVTDGASAWIGTAQGLVRLEPPIDDAAYRVAFSADVGFINDVVRLGESRILAASASHGLIESDGRSWWTYRCKGLSGSRVLQVAVGGDGTLLVGTDTGLHVIDDAAGRVIAHIDANGGDSTVTAVAVAEDLFWVAFARTLVAYRKTTSGFELSEKFRVASQINDLLPDPLGNIWIATDNFGLAQVSCLRHAIERIELGRAGGVYTIRSGQDDFHLLGGENLFGIAELSDSRDRALLHAPGGLPETTTWDSLEDSTGLWVATQAGLFHALKDADNRFTQCFARDPVLGAPARALLARDGELWVGTLRGLARIRNAQVQVIEPDDHSLGYVYAMNLDALARLWVATLGRGLWTERDGVLAQLTCDVLSGDGNTYAIEHGPDGSVLVLQDEKIVLIERDSPPRLITELSPVSGWSALWIDARTIAIGASDGLRILDLTSGTITSRVDLLFALRDWEFTNNRTLIRDSSDRLLCGVNGGLLRVDLEGLRRFSEPPKCKLLDVVFNGAQPDQNDGVFTLRPGRWSCRVRAFAAWFVGHASVRFQFKLVGFESTWSAATDRPEVTFNSLPPGSYQLLARASCALTGFGPEAEVLRLEVERPWWTRGWTPILTGIAMAYDWLVRSRTRNRALLAENRRLESAVLERTQSLRGAYRELESARDALQRLSELDELTKLGNRRNFDRELGRSMALVTRLQLPLALLLVDVDYFKAVNDQYGHPVGDEYLRTLGKVLQVSIRSGEDVATRFGGEEFALILANSDRSQARVQAERIRAAVADLNLPNERAPSGRLSVSIGISAMLPDSPMSADELLARADRALYRAKLAGRDRVVCD